MSLLTDSVRARLFKAIDAVATMMAQRAANRPKASRRRRPPSEHELRAECEMLESRRLLNGVTAYINPPYFVIYVDYSFQYSWEDCCGQEHGIQVGLQAMYRNDAAAASSFGPRLSVSQWPINMLNGQPLISATDIDSQGFGQTWGQSRTWNDAAGKKGDQSVNGNHWSDVQMPQLMQVGTQLAVLDDGQSLRWFDTLPGGEYTEHGVPNGDTLRYDSVSGDYIVADATGATETFGAPSGTAGQLLAYSDPGGNATNFTYAGASDPDGYQSGQLKWVTRSNGSNVESWHYFYLGVSDPNAGELSAVVLRRSTTGTSGPWTDIREADYTYYTGGTGIPGNAGDLQSVTVRVGAANDSTPGTGAVIGTTDYQYYTSITSAGYVGGLKYVFGPEASAQAKAAGYDPLTSTDDAHLQLYADNYFEYGNNTEVNDAAVADHMVTKEIAHGAGCSCAAEAGQGTIFYDYLGNANYNNTVTDYNQWLMRTTTLMPDGNHEVVYSNFAGAPILDVQQELDTAVSVTGISGSGSTWTVTAPGHTYHAGDTVVISGADYASDNGTFIVQSVSGNMFTVTNPNGGASSSATAQYVKHQWMTYNRYDSQGRTLWTANPSAVTGYSEANSDLVGYNPSSNTATYVSSSTGLIDDTDYYSTGWTIGGNAGIAANSSSISGALAAHDGTQAAFLKDTTGTVSQTFTAGGGSAYTLQFWGGYLSGSGTAPQVQVELDGSLLGSPITLGTSYAQYTVSLGSPAAGAHTVTFVEVGTGTGTPLLDTVALTGTGAPALADPGFESPSLDSGTYVYDPLGSTATAAVAGGVMGLPQDRKVQQGLGGTAIIQQQWAYLSQGGGSSGPASVRYLPGTDTMYGLDHGTASDYSDRDPRTTRFSYTFFPNTTQIKQQTTINPPVLYTQNGPASSVSDTTNADTTTEVFDSYGRVQWTIDGDHYVQHMEYDNATGAVTKTVVDAPPYQATVLADTPVGYWRLGESSGTTAADATGNGNSGTYSGTYTLGQSGALSGDSDTAVSFTSGQVSGGGLATNAAGDSYTVESWIKPSSGNTGGTIFVKGQGGSSFGYGISLTGTTINVVNTTSDFSVTGATVTLNQWNHVVAVFTSSGTTVYVNGAVAGSVAQTSTADSHATWAIGKRPINGVSPFVGTIDEVAVYKGALTAAQIANHYSAGAGTYGQRTHLNLVTTYQVDGLGRPTQIVRDVGQSDQRIDAIVYNDSYANNANTDLQGIRNEVRVYRGWNTTTHTATGPTEVTFEYLPQGTGQSLYEQTLTSSATPTYNSTTNLPTGQESFTASNIQSLSRDITNGARQVVETDDYFSLSGLTYAVAAAHVASAVASNDSSSGNYHATFYGYDDLGRRNHVKLPTGTIQDTVYDMLGGVTSRWIGTDDTPLSGDDWSPTNNGGNMVEVEDDEYDSTPAPTWPSTSTVSGSGPLGLFFVRITYVINSVETAASPERSIRLTLGNELSVASPASGTGISGYNVYIGTSPGTEVLQNSTPISIGTSFSFATQVTGTRLVPEAGVGDGNLTRVTFHPGTTAPADRITDNLYDWRDRLVLSKQGGSVTETDGEHRPIYYYTLDNLGEVTQTDKFDGDTVSPFSLGSTSGVPNAPSSSVRRARSAAAYDDQGRVFEAQTFDVTQSGVNAGTVNSAVNTWTWYDHRGDVIKDLVPGGLVHKYVFDGAGRETTVYATDGGGDVAPGGSSNSWTDANTVTGDTVLSQTETQYDGDGNPTLVTDRERMHDTTGTGGLSGPTSATNAARVYYTASYYDPADRLTDFVNLGTNSGTTVSSPPSLASLPAGSLHTVYSYVSDNVQTVTLTGPPTSGTFTLSFNGSGQTAAIAITATAATVQSDLQALSTIGTGNVVVTGPAGGPWTVRFAGTLAGKGQPSLVATSSLTGGSVAIGTLNLGGDAGAVRVATDPRTIASRTYADLLGRTTSTIAAFTDGNPTNSSNQRTDYTYDGDNHLLTQKAWQPTGTSPDHQTTAYVYADNGSNGIASNDLLDTIENPDPTTGNPSTAAANDQNNAYNALGQSIRNVVDANGTTRIFTYDTLGRLTQDTVSNAGAGIDTSVLSLIYAYDTNGGLLTASSYSGGAGTGTLLNQVEEAYNGLGQLAGEYQSHSGAVVTGTTPEVQYNYHAADGASDGGRATSIVYPNTRQLNFNYNTGIDANISRISSLADAAGTGAGNIESYSYLGLGTIVRRLRPGSDLTYVKASGESNGAAGDQYNGLDEFGRVIDQRWVTADTVGSGGSGDVLATLTERFQYGYDADSNVLYKNNLMSSSNSELYHANSTASGDNNSAYDNLNRLKSFSRGTLSSSGHNGTGLDQITSPTATNNWTLDTLGNWTGTGAQTRTVNARNEYTGVSGKTTPTYDNNGNLTKDENGQQYVYDAWNRLVTVKNSAGTVTDTYAYDGFGRRIKESPASGTATDLYLDTSGRVLEERQGSTVTRQYVWGLGYPNDLVLRDDNTGSTNNYGTATSGLHTRLYVQQDANFNVTSLVNPSGTVQERYQYDPYGTVTVLTAGFALRGTGAPSASLFSWQYLFQGGRLDTTSLLYHFGRRDYSTTLGRWTEPDGGYWDGANLYQADDSNPEGRLDPTGTDSIALGWNVALQIATQPTGPTHGMFRGAATRPTTKPVYDDPTTVEPILDNPLAPPPVDPRWKTRTPQKTTTKTCRRTNHIKVRNDRFVPVDRIDDVLDALDIVLDTPHGGDYVSMLDKSGTDVTVTISTGGFSNGQPAAKGKPPYVNIQVNDIGTRPVQVRLPDGSTEWVGASLPRILAHELGHAVTGLDDDLPDPGSNVKRNENPIVECLGLWPRIRYAKPGK